MHLYLLFQSYCGGPPPAFWTLHVRSKNASESTYVHQPSGRTRGRIGFHTLSSPMFEEFRSLFYPMAFKPFLLTSGSFLQPVHWRTGRWTTGIETSVALVSARRAILTLSFSYVKVMKDNFHLYCTLRKRVQGHRIYIRTDLRSMKRFGTLVTPYFHHSML
jgi:hypothetical protein